MATVRKLITKLSFEADLSQADKFERRIDQLKKKVVLLDNALSKISLKAPKIPAPELAAPPKLTLFQLFRDKLKSLFLKIKNIIKDSKVGKAYREWIKKFKENNKNLNKFVLEPLRKLNAGLKKVLGATLETIKQSRFKIVAAIIGTIAAARSALLKAATIEDLDIIIKTVFPIKDINKGIKDLRKELKFGDIFTEIDIKTGIANAIKAGFSPETIKRFLRPAILGAAKAQTTFEDALGTILASTVTGAEEPLTRFGVFTQEEILQRKIAKRSLSDLISNRRKEEVILSKFGNNEIALQKTLADTIGSTTGKTKKLMGAIEEGAVSVGKSIDDNVKKSLDDSLAVIKTIKGLLKGELGIESLLGGEGPIQDLLRSREGKKETRQIPRQNLPNPNLREFFLPTKPTGTTVGQVNININESVNPQATAQAVKSVLDSQNLQTQARLSTLTTLAVGAEATP